MPLQILKRGHRGLFFRTSKTTTAEARRVTLAKWVRKDGRCSFLADMIALRKPLLLCNNDANFRLPRRWKSLYNYEELTRFHGEGACDLCRQEGAVSLYLAGDEPVWQEYEQARLSVAASRLQEQLAVQASERKYLIRV